MSASHEKTIQINREFFKMSGTGKKTAGRNQTRKVANASKNNTANDRRTELIRSIKKARSSKPSTTAPALTALGDAISFFNSEQKTARKRGFRGREQKNTVVGLGEMPVTLREGVQQSTLISSPVLKGTEPRYGCLKNGKKPTYRQWRTRRQGVNLESKVIPPVTTSLPQTVIQNESVVIQDPPKISTSFKPRKEKLDAVRQKSRTHYAKARTIPIKHIRRTRKIGVHGDNLIIATPSSAERDAFKKAFTEIKGTPIADVNKHLIANGLTTYGGSAPDDVKRQIFEDGWMAGGAKAIDSDIAVNNVLSMGAI